MKRMIVYLILGLLVGLSVSGCQDHSQEAYQKGYQAGYAEGSYDSEKVCQTKVDEEKSICNDRMSNSFSNSYGASTEVCGGGGVNVNGKHYPGGKKGCVRVFSDGRVERY